VAAFGFVALAIGIDDAVTERDREITGAPPGYQAPAEAPAPEAAVAPADELALPEAEAPDEAIWEGDDLVQLPRDPQKRRAALDEAAARAQLRMAASQAVPHLQGAAGFSPEPPRSRSTEDRVPEIAPFIPDEVRRGEKTWGLNLPDDFTPPREELMASFASGPNAQVVRDEAVQAAFAPALMQTFGGIDQTTLTPPDCDAAAGPDHIVAVVNSSWAFYDKCGNQGYTATFATFLGDGTNFLFDPKVMYDTWDSRWIVSICARNNSTQDSWVVLMVSDDSNPFGSWCWYYLDFTLNGGTPTGWWADYQDVSTTPDGIVVTTNQFDWSTPTRIFQYAKIRSLDKTQIFACGAYSWWDFWNMNNPGDGSKAFTLRPAILHSWPGNMWLVNSKPGGGTILTLWNMGGTPLAPTLAGTNINVALYDNGDPMLQPGGLYVDTGGARLLNAVYLTGDLWAGHTIRYNWGEPTDRTNIQVFQLDTYTIGTVNYQNSFGNSGLYYSYPAVDFDNLKNGIVCFARGGPAEFPGSRYVDLSQGGPWGGSNLLVAGQTNYTGGSAPGTFSNPKRWGDYYGCARDPYDNKTLWFYGQFASNSPAGTWDTQVGAAAPNGNGVLSVTPTTTFISTGLQGGPFTPSAQVYNVSNTGGAAIPWALTGLQSWQSASASSGKLQAGGATNVTVSINAVANGLGPGTYNDAYSFTNCYTSGGTLARSTQLTVGVDESCPGSIVRMTPPGVPPDVTSTTTTTQQRGIYITALKDFEVCALGFEATYALPQTLTARIYEASGVTRGALVATGSLTAVQTGKLTHYVAINATLEACKEYDVSIEFSGTATWDWWDENLGYEPFDVGPIRVRDGESNGGAGNFALPPMSIIGSTPAAAEVAELGPDNSPPSTSTNQNQERGIYVQANETVRMCSFGWYANLPAGQTLSARVYAATGTTRGAVVAEGTFVTTGTGYKWHDIPVNATLSEGGDYDLAIQFGSTTQWRWWCDSGLTMPYTAGPLQVVSAEAAGSTSNCAIMEYRMGWDTAGAPFDLAKQNDVYPPPFSTGQDASNYGAYVTSLIDQELYSLGWMADIPLGSTITARIYQATGTTRGALLAQGAVTSTGDGMRWHDVPLSISLAAGQDYDFTFVWGTVNEWRYWNDLTPPPVPYDAYGVMQVRDSEANGGAGNFALIHMRYNGCDATLTPVADDSPQRVPMFLATPAPNPVSGTANISFALEEAGPVTIHVYDVAGRKVATVLENAGRAAGWNQASLDSGQLPSGVYFLKMSTKLQSMSRKFVVAH
jgi:hypothetical protein